MGEKVRITGTARGSHVSDHPYRLDLSVGLSLRDLFAAFALPAIIQADFARSISHPEEAAKDAYKFADAILAARGETEG